MIIENLNKKYGKNYQISKGCIVTKGNQKSQNKPEKICDFYITSVDFITRFGERVFFKIDYYYDGTEDSVIVPYEDYNDPNHWVKYYMTECKNLTTTKEFNKAIIEITTNLASNKKDVEFYKKSVGWFLKKYDDDNKYSLVKGMNKLLNRNIYYFSDDYQETDLKKGENINSMLKYCIDNDDSIGTLLSSYLLYSLLLRLNISKELKNNRLIMSLTGGKSEHHRNRTALFYTNVIKRHSDAIASDYKFFHILPGDTPSIIDTKALRMNAGVIIAFNPSTAQSRHIETIFTFNPIKKQYHKNKKLPAVLIVKESVQQIPFQTLNITIPADYKIKEIYENYQKGHKIDNLMIDIYNYTSELGFRVSTEKTEIIDDFNQHKSKFDENYPKLSEDAREVAIKLTFATKLYLDYAIEKGIIDENSYKSYKDKCESTIIDRIAESFHKKSDILLTPKQQAIEICKALDSHFKTSNNRIKVCNIGEKPPKPSLAQIWCDKDTINISAKNIEEILKLENCKYKLNKYTKIALAEMGYINTIKVGENETTEYSLHIQTPLYEKQKTRERFIRFNRQKCIDDDLLTNIDGISFIRNIDNLLKHIKKGKKKVNKIDIIQKEHTAATEPTISNLDIIPENNEPIFEETPLNTSLIVYKAPISKSPTLEETPVSEPQVSTEVLEQASVPTPEETLKNDESTLREKLIINDPIVKELLKMHCPTLDITQAIDDKTLKEILKKENPALESYIEILGETQENDL